MKKREKQRQTSIDSIEAITDVKIDYPIIHKDDMDALGGRNTTEDRYHISSMESER